VDAIVVDADGRLHTSAGLTAPAPEKRLIDGQQGG
jgi:hypothetical protein